MSSAQKRSDTAKNPARREERKDGEIVRKQRNPLPLKKLKDITSSTRTLVLLLFLHNSLTPEYTIVTMHQSLALLAQPQRRWHMSVIVVLMMNLFSGLLEIRQHPTPLPLTLPLPPTLLFLLTVPLLQLVLLVLLQLVLLLYPP